MTMLPPGIILLPVPQCVFVPIPQVYIVPVLQQTPNPNNHGLIMEQTTPLISVNVPNLDMNVHSCNAVESNALYQNDKQNDLINNGSNKTPTLYLSDSDSDVVEWDSGSDMSIIADDDDDDDDGDDDYVDDDDDEESISGAYWF